MKKIVVLFLTLLSISIYTKPKKELRKDSIKNIKMDKKKLKYDLNYFVNIDNKFLIGKYEVTQKEYKNIMGKNPSHFKGDNLPVEKVSWYDAIKFCNKKSIKEGLESVYTINGKNVKIDKTKNGYRLPNSEEWEYVAKGGSLSKNYQYSGSNNIDDVAWYRKNSKFKTHPVGTKKPNELGVYDMIGNVWEWCNDSVSNAKIMRGGAWKDNGDAIKIFDEFGSVGAYYFDNQIGFRIVRSL